MLRFISSLLFLIFLNCTLLFSQNNHDIFTIDVEEVNIDPDSLENKYLQDYFESDSIQVIKYEKLEWSYDGVHDERIVFIDYRIDTRIKREYKNLINNFYELIKTTGHYYEPELPDSVEPIDNRYPILNDIYVPVYFFKGKLVGFEGTSYRKAAIKDEGFYFYDWEGWERKPISSASDEDNIYQYELLNYGARLEETKICPLSDSVQVWKEISTRPSDRPSVFYRLMAPLSVAINLPIVEPFLTSGVDNSFEDFDEFNHEKYFE